MKNESEDIRHHARQLYNDSIDNKSKETGIRYYEKQIELITEQKEFVKIIKYSTIVTTIATVVMSLAIIAQCIIMILLSQR